MINSDGLRAHIETHSTTSQAPIPFFTILWVNTVGIPLKGKTVVNERKALNFLEEVEKRLQSKNFVYRKMRQDYGRLDSPMISIVKEGSFNSLDTERIRETGVRQIKPINLEQNPQYKKKFEIEATYFLRNTK